MVPRTGTALGCPNDNSQSHNKWIDAPVADRPEIVADALRVLVRHLRPHAIQHDGKTLFTLADAMTEAADTITALRAEVEQLKADLERERMRLAACGVVALSNTPESAAKARQMAPEYWSASCGDVERAVDREMALRSQLSARDAELRALREDRRCRALLGEGTHLGWHGMDVEPSAKGAC